MKGGRTCSGGWGSYLGRKVKGGEAPSEGAARPVNVVVTSNTAKKIISNFFNEYFALSLSLDLS